LSYESIVSQLRAIDPVAAGGRVVVAHLGNGASLCAMRGGQSVATTMSFSPLDGLPMGTRCGRLDAAVVLHLWQRGESAAQVSRWLHHESGLLGLSGVSSDMRVLQASNEPSARMAVDYFVEHLLRELAGMVAALQGIDTVVFTGGMGENAAVLRARGHAGAGWLGLALDDVANDAGHELISAKHSAVQVRVMRTNEEGVIAQHTARLVGR
jgi:acetate kinase